MPQNLVELEKLCGEAAAKAISSYHTATCAIQDYNKDIIEVIENLDTAEGNSKLWDRLETFIVIVYWPI